MRESGLPGAFHVAPRVLGDHPLCKPGGGGNPKLAQTINDEVGKPSNRPGGLPRRLIQG